MDDLISKQAVLDAIDAYKWLDGNDAIYRLKQWLEDQEHVIPAMKVGHWELDEHLDKIGMIYKYMCSECGANHRAMYDYCPSCGSYNGGDAE